MDLLVILETAGICVAIGLAAFYVLWVLYLAVMNLKRVKDAGNLSKTAWYLGLPLLWLGLLVDTMVNVFVLSFILLEFPQEALVTSRLKRHNRTGSGWRKSVAAWFEPIIDPFDPSGDHI